MEAGSKPYIMLCIAHHMKSLSPFDQNPPPTIANYENVSSYYGPLNFRFDLFHNDLKCAILLNYVKTCFKY